MWANDPRAVRDYQGLAAQIEWRPTQAVEPGRQRDALGPERQLPGRGGDSARRRRHARHLRAIEDVRRHHVRGLGARCSTSTPSARACGAATPSTSTALGNLNLTGLLTGDWTAGSGTSASRFGLPAGQRPGVPRRERRSTRSSSTTPSRRSLTATPSSTWPLATTCRSSGKFGIWVKATVLNVTNEDELLSAGRTGVQNGLVNGVPAFIPLGNCGFDSEPSRNCTRLELDHFREQLRAAPRVPVHRRSSATRSSTSPPPDSGRSLHRLIYDRLMVAPIDRACAG